MLLRPIFFGSHVFICQRSPWVKYSTYDSPPFLLPRTLKHIEKIKPCSKRRISERERERDEWMNVENEIVWKAATQEWPCRIINKKGTSVLKWRVMLCGLLNNFIILVRWIFVSCPLFVGFIFQKLRGFCLFVYFIVFMGFFYCFILLISFSWFFAFELRRVDSRRKRMREKEEGKNRKIWNSVSVWDYFAGSLCERFLFEAFETFEEKLQTAFHM